MFQKIALGMLVLAAACPAVTVGLEVSLEHSFNPGLGLLDGIGVEEATGNVFVHNRVNGIIVLAPDGTQLRTLPTPGNQTNDFDLDFALRELSIGGISVPVGSLLAFNGDDNPEKLYGLDPVSGAVLASVNLVTQSLVGGADVPALNAVVAVDWVVEALRFLDPDDGSLLNLVTPQLPFDVNYGDVDFVTASGNLLVVSSNVPAIREVDVEGFCMRDIALGHLGITEVSGIAVDEARGDYWLSSTTGNVYRVRLTPTLVDTDNDGVLDEDDNCLAEPNPDQTDADSDGIGNACDADLNNNCVVNFEDLGVLKSVFFSNDPVADLNTDGAVNFLDLSILKRQFFQPPGPSGEGGPCGCGL